MKSFYTAKAHAELKALEEMPGSEINLEDIPEVRDWSEGIRGKFYRPVKL